MVYVNYTSKGRNEGRKGRRKEGGKKGTFGEGGLLGKMKQSHTSLVGKQQDNE